MRKTITLLTIILLVVFMIGCENSINPTQPTNNDHTILAKQSNPDEIAINASKGGKNKVEICHLTGNGKYVTISVAESAVPAHMAHGDMYPAMIPVGDWVVDFLFGSSHYIHEYNFDDGTGIYPKGGYIERIDWIKD